MKFNKKAELKHHFNEHISYLYEEGLKFDNIWNKNILCFNRGVNENSQIKQLDANDYQIVNEIQFGVYVDEDIDI